PGRRPSTVTAIARWMVDYLRKHPAGQLRRVLFDAAGLIGELKEDDKGRLRWSGGNMLYRAADHVPDLEGEHAGFRINRDQEEKDTRGYAQGRWQLAPTDEEETDGSLPF